MANQKRKTHFGLMALLNLLFGKMAIIGLLIVVQVAVLVFFVIKLAAYFAAVYAILTLLSVGIVVWLVSKDENPSYKLAWVILVMALPIFGGLFYLVFGNKNLPVKLRHRITETEKSERLMYAPEIPCLPALEEDNQQLAALSRFISNTTGAPLWGNTEAEYLPIGEIMWQRMLEELRNAERFIFMEYFIIEEGEMWNSILEVLKEKVAEGVEVRVMYDDIGSIQTLRHGYEKQLHEAGIQCLVFNRFQPHLNSVMNYRDHRKITVIDGNVGFCGGINLADEYINAYQKHGHWKDTGVLLRGSGVWNLTAMFLSLWNFTKPSDTQFETFKPTIRCKHDGFVQPFGDSPLDRVNVCEESYMQIINRASKYVYITTPYLILDNEMVTALQMAARSGVDVRIVTPAVPDKWVVHETTRSFYKALLNTGVRIFEYTPGFVHAKMYVADDNLAIVGTANMDYRSFFLHFECGVCFYNASTVIDVRNDIQQVIEQCREVSMDETVALWRRIIRAFLRLFSPIM